MQGIVTRNPTELTWGEFDRGFFELKRSSGRIAEPVANGVNLISCFGDTAAIETDPDLVARTLDGQRAGPDGSDTDRGYVCPSRGEYRDRLLALVSEAVERSPDVRLDDIGFPGSGYCHCDACNAAFEDSELAQRSAWRTSVVTDFVTRVAEVVPGRLFIGIPPDPYPGHLERQAGIDVDTLDQHVDEYVVPLYDTTYGTSYWIDVIAGGFASRLSAPFGVELYAADASVDGLAEAAEAAGNHAEHVYYGYDAGTARGTIRRQRAEANEGIEHR